PAGAVDREMVSALPAARPTEPVTWNVYWSSTSVHADGGGTVPTRTAWPMPVKCCTSVAPLDTAVSGVFSLWATAIAAASTAPAEPTRATRVRTLRRRRRRDAGVWGRPRGGRLCAGGACGGVPAGAAWAAGGGGEGGGGAAGGGAAGVEAPTLLTGVGVPP